MPRALRYYQQDRQRVCAPLVEQARRVGLVVTSEDPEIRRAAS